MKGDNDLRLGAFAVLSVSGLYFLGLIDAIQGDSLGWILGCIFVPPLALLNGIVALFTLIFG